VRRLMSRGRRRVCARAAIGRSARSLNFTVRAARAPALCHLMRFPVAVPVWICLGVDDLRRETRTRLSS